MTRRFLLLALLATACNPTTPTQRAWPAYSVEVKKILNEYDEAMLGVANIDVALSAVPGSTTTVMAPEAAVKEIETKVIPLLEKAATHAASIQTPNSSRLTAMHRPLAEALAAKSDAYKSMVSGFKKRDTTEFDKGVTKLTEASNLLGTFRKEFTTAVVEGGPRE